MTGPYGRDVWPVRADLGRARPPPAGRSTARYGPKVPVTAGSVIAAVGTALLLTVPVPGGLTGVELAPGVLGCGPA